MNRSDGGRALPRPSRSRQGAAARPAHPWRQGRALRKVATAMAAAQRAGVRKIGFVTTRSNKQGIVVVTPALWHGTVPRKPLSPRAGFCVVEPRCSDRRFATPCGTPPRPPQPRTPSPRPTAPPSGDLLHEDSPRRPPSPPPSAWGCCSLTREDWQASCISCTWGRGFISAVTGKQRNDGER